MPEIVAQTGQAATSLAAALRRSLAGIAFDRLDVAVAYATRSGVRALGHAVGRWPARTRWVVGLDDCITQPEAIDDLVALPGATVRLATLASQGRRFHPKLYCFWSSADPARCLLAVGSANMTDHGLRLNAEAGVILSATSAAEADRLKSAWTTLQALGTPFAPADLAAYRLAHATARKARRRMVRVGALRPDEEASETTSRFAGNPATAAVAWTEGASPSAGGRDLEFPAAMMPFFRLPGSPAPRRLRMSRTTAPFELTFTRRPDNQMWRLLFSRDAIQAAIGRDSLRPVAGGNRSDLAIVFRRGSGAVDYDVDLVVIGGADHAALIAASQAAGGLRRTNGAGGRYFGFF